MDNVIRKAFTGLIKHNTAIIALAERSLGLAGSRVNIAVERSIPYTLLVILTFDKDVFGKGRP